MLAMSRRSTAATEGIVGFMSASDPDSLPDTIKLEALKQSLAPRQTLATLVVVQGSEADLGAHARVEGRVRIGRDPQVELTLTDARASKHHAAVEVVAGRRGRVRYEVEDLGSTNGTLLNGKKVKGRQRLEDGDKLTLASTVLRFALADEVDASFHAQVEAMLSMDELTGLLAHRRFEGALDEAIKTAHARAGPLALLVLDLDGLKAINDAHGHATGASTIGQVGRLLTKVLAGRGIATRFGGDEFVAFLPGLDRAEGAKVAEELRARVEAHRFERAGVVVHPTVSIGVAAFPQSAMAAGPLFEAADRALYRAKTKGRNRVEL